MNPVARLVLFLVAGAVAAAIFVCGIAALHPTGETAGLPAEVYGNAINTITVPETHITDAATAVNFDFRAFDALAEAFLFFAAVVAVLLLLRRLERSEIPARVGASAPRVRDSGRGLTVALVGPTVLFGIYLVVHGQVRPGGGFQGGVVLAAALLLAYLADGFRAVQAVAPRWLLEIGGTLGAAAFVVIGGLGVIGDNHYLRNFLPNGAAGDVFSGGSVALIDIAVGVEVAAAFMLLLFAFLEEAPPRNAP